MKVCGSVEGLCFRRLINKPVKEVAGIVMVCGSVEGLCVQQTIHKPVKEMGLCPHSKQQIPDRHTSRDLRIPTRTSPDGSAVGRCMDHTHLNPGQILSVACFTGSPSHYSTPLPLPCVS